MLKPFLQPQQQPPKRVVLSVSELNLQSKRLLESNLGSVWLGGEISNFTRASSGHWYFSLKDNKAQISCAMFRFKTQNMTFAPNEGDKVVVKGKVSLYEARGNYQMIVDFMEPAGLGDLQQQLNLLMQKLQAQGLFALENKRQLPSFPQTIGVVTSPTGAAIHDVLTVLKRRCPMVSVIIYPTQVQGMQAAQSILHALNLAESRQECDALLITRGGGSLEDLWSFNDEAIAHKVRQMPMPTVAAIGHEVDTTITELVADLRAATPSAAAELLVPDRMSLQQQVDIYAQALAKALSQQIQQLQNRLNTARLMLSDPEQALAANQYKLDKLKQHLAYSKKQLIQQHQVKLDKLIQTLEKQNPQTRLNIQKQRLTDLKLKLANAWKNQHKNFTHQLHLNAKSLNNLSPLSTLTRGYSIVRDKNSGDVLTSVTQVRSKQDLTLVLKDGEVNAKVESS
jgi:exodeoxyribonuclease VII large subunit